MELTWVDLIALFTTGIFLGIIIGHKYLPRICEECTKRDDKLYNDMVADVWAPLKSDQPRNQVED